MNKACVGELRNIHIFDIGGLCLTVHAGVFSHMRTSLTARSFFVQQT